MTETFIPDDATRAQIDAADPSGSVWLAANAGSGKTRVLTDRVAWLLLEGTAPEQILCLTYTRAAAGEMQNRLFARLGSWAMMEDTGLRAELHKLGVPVGRVSPQGLRHARTLFARAIETPGGLKIQTIHAFCASLLRRFPLEAGVSPAFSEMDDTARARLHADILDEMAVGDDAPLVDAMAARLSDGEPSTFLAGVAKAWPVATEPLGETTLRARLGIGADTDGSIRAEAVGADMLDLMDAFITAAKDAPGTSVDRLASKLQEARIADLPTRFDLLTECCVTSAGERRKTGGWPKTVKDGIHGPLVELFNLMIDRVEDALRRLGALTSLDFALTLHAFAPAFVNRLHARKQALGWLDFDDQIARARHLLSTSDMAQWVLFKLDGGLDHILVDEAQDTAPAQWDVIAALAAEFGAGQGARPDVTRTLFVVGDRKQSIYSFQGADPDAFDRMRTVFEAQLPDGTAPLRDHALRHSFRSSPVILDLVDATFADGGGIGTPPVHLAFKPDLPGRVDLWPPIPKEKADYSSRVWSDPIDMPAPNDATVLLAEQVAETVATMIRDRTPIVHKGARRAITEGDILILLQRRTDLFHHVIHACKARGLNLAGADRLKLLGDLAVRDLIALLTWAATPEDDLSLATVLRSPLGDVDEQGLFGLAHGREKRPLWSVVRDSGRNTGFLDDILKVADILRPYEILQRVLVRHDGRRRLLARLGAEREEAIDALLGQALAYERLETPSLAGFLGWLGSADVDLKREASRGSIRVMTVHGAKGLESPVVILPETQMRAPNGPKCVRRLADGTPVWLPNKSGWAPVYRDMAEQAADAEAAERDRLLYVALTRAESWLIVGAAGDVGKEVRDSWWKQVEGGIDALGPKTLDDGTRRLQRGDWSRIDPDATATMPDAGPTLPDWVHDAVPPHRKSPKPLAPSGLPGTKVLPGDPVGDTHAAMARGTAIHLLLEHLPHLPRTEWEGAIPSLLRGLPLDAAPEAIAVLEDPTLAAVFARDTLAEVPFVLPPSAGRPGLVGTLDRVLVTPKRVTLVDFKSNGLVPDRAEDTPVGVLAQLGAYRAAALAIWPGRTVRQAILWTRTRSLMDLPPDLVTLAWDQAIDPGTGRA
ncbi:MAG: double-strand break repair helicase AddA [Jannaschia sp.]